MNKSEKIRLIYSIAIGIAVVAIGVALICVAADIYYSGRDTGVIFTRAIVARRLQAFAIPFMILVGSIICGAIFPLAEVRAKNRSENAVRLLSAKLSCDGDGAEYAKATRTYKKLCALRRYMWLGESVILAACTIAVLCYVLNTSYFLGTDITQEIFRMVQNVLPWIGVAFATLIAVAVGNGILATKQLKALKTLLRYGNGAPMKREPGAIEKVQSVLSRDTTLWAVRGAVFVVAVTFIILGIVNGGAHDVLVKAINICTECIGLG